VRKTNLPPLTSTAQDPAGAPDILPLKPLAQISDPWMPWLIALLVLAAIIFLIWWWKRRKRAPAAEPALPRIAPDVRARQRLEQALGLMSDPRLFCIAVSEALRDYLEEQFNLHAPDRTTEEFLIELGDASYLTPEQKLRMADFLQRCDLVKFAKLEPTERELRDVAHSATRLVDETASLRVQTAYPEAREARL